MAQLENEFGEIKEKIEEELASPDVSLAAGARLDTLLDRLEQLTRLLYLKHTEHVRQGGLNEFY